MTPQVFGNRFKSRLSQYDARLRYCSTAEQIKILRHAKRALQCIKVSIMPEIGREGRALARTESLVGQFLCARIVIFISFFLRRTCSLKTLFTVAPCDVKKMLLRVPRKFSDEDKLGKAANTIKAVKSFMAYHDRSISFKRNEKVSCQKKRIEYEYIPTKEDVYRIVDSTRQLRSKAVILCLFQSGVRVNCICRWTY